MDAAIAITRQYPAIENLVERTVLVSRKDLLDTSDFQSQLELSPAKRNHAITGNRCIDSRRDRNADDKKALDFHRNKISKAAASLGLTRSSLYRRLEKYNIPYDETPE